MPTITLHRWIITDERGRRRPTRYAMREAEALALDPTAERVPGTDEVRQVHEPGEYPGHHQIAPQSPRSRGADDER